MKIAARLWKDERKGRKEEGSRRKEDGDWGLGSDRPTRERVKYSSYAVTIPSPKVQPVGWMDACSTE
jgi:hypothetical protein